MIKTTELSGEHIYMHIQVMLDARGPLKRRKRIRMESGAWAIIQFKYERLQAFCFR